MQLPTTTINSNTTITLRRILPVPGEVLVQTGRQVTALDVVARAEVPSRYRIIDIARQLAQPRVDMSEVMLVNVGDAVEANQVIASLKGTLSIFQRSVRAPAAGHIASIGSSWVLLETERTTTEIQAFADGVVSRVIANRGVLIKTRGAVIEAACGFGGEAYGRLKRLVDSAFEVLDPTAIDEEMSESIILGGRTVDEETLRKAEECQVRGIIVGSINASLFKLNLPVKVRVVATEGFGNIAMSAYTFGLLSSLTNREISIRGEMPNLTGEPKRSFSDEASMIIAATTSRPDGGSVSTSPTTETKVGSRVRIIRGNLLGTSGTIASILPEPQVLESGIIASGVNIKTGGKIYFVPWANLKQIG